MKKIHITLAVLSLAAIMNTACDKREQEIGGKPELGSDVIAFALKGAQTRAEVSNYEVSKEVNIIPLGTDGQGNIFSLEESVVDLNSPVTRGTPAYTQNVHLLYDGQIAVTSPQLGGFDAKYNDSQERYLHSFGKEIWKNDDGSSRDNLEFYMNMPSSPTGVDITSRTGGAITFTYTSPETATAQQDILFTYRNISKTDYDKNGYADVLFHHALTGVKFATANHISGAENGTKTYITKVVFKGLADGGTCTVTPTTENGEYVDDPDVFSSSEDGVVVWTNPTYSGSENGIYQEFTKDNYAENIYAKSTLLKENETAPSSFFAEDKATGLGKKSTDWNINDSEGTMTFWLVPQTLTDNVTMEVTFYIDAGGREGQPITRTIEFGKLTNYADWKAGQLRTYVLKANDVDVEITDELDNNVKNNLKITNLGNAPQYVRATIVAYWADENGNAVFGYNGEESDTYIEPWNLAYEVAGSGYTTIDGSYGVISNFYPSTDATNWYTSSSDGYYYYKSVIGVDEAYTHVMFESYKLDETKIPEIWQIDQKTLKRTKVSGVHLVMEVACQAVIAREDSSTSTGYVAWNDAWKEATGYDPSASN